MAMINFNMPVLIYISKQGCPACIKFAAEWENIKQRVSDVIIVKFVCSNTKLPHPSIAKYAAYVPTILMAGPKSYYKVFTIDDKENDVDYNPKSGYIIKAIKYDLFDENNKPIPGRGNTAENIIRWIHENYDTVRKIDEPHLPKKYI